MTVRVGLVGYGRIAQAAHMRFLRALPDHFEVRGVADPSPGARALARRRVPGVATTETVEQLLELELDAVVISTPAVLHGAHVVAALEAGCHVLCEKPLAYTPGACADIIAARDRRGLVVQVGYMKRFDPNVARLLDLVADPSSGAVLQIDHDVLDPHHRPFSGPHRLLEPGDLAAEHIEHLIELEREQVAEAVGPTDAPLYRAYRHGFAGSLIHQVNLIHAVLDRIDEAGPMAVVGGATWSEGAGVGVECTLASGGRARASHLALVGVPDYRDRLVVSCERRVLDLEFTSPYALHLPARLTERAARDGHVVRTIHEPTTDEPFEAQLLAFHGSVVDDAPVRNPPEEAVKDLAVVLAAHGFARRRPS